MGYDGIQSSRAVTNDSPEGLEIVIPAPRVWPVVAFLAFWLAGWATGEVFALRQILSPGPAAARVFLAGWLAFWTFGGVSALAICLWMLVGHERVRLRPDALVIQREAFGLGPTRVYALDGVRNLRAAPLPALPTVPAAGGATAPPEEQAKAALNVIGIRGPGISFTYAHRPVRFGVALDPAEARGVVAQLSARHSFPEGLSAA